MTSTRLESRASRPEVRGGFAGGFLGVVSALLIVAGFPWFIAVGALAGGLVIILLLTRVVRERRARLPRG